MDIDLFVFALHNSTRTGEWELPIPSCARRAVPASSPLSIISCAKGSGNFVLSAGLLWSNASFV